MTRYVTVDESYANQTLRMITDVQGNPVIVQAGSLVTPDAFDHVVQSVSDLPAAAGGYHTLTAGSWAFIASLDLGTNGLRILAGTTVYMTGLGWARFLTSTATNVVLVEGTLLIENMRLTSGTVGARILVANSASAMLYVTNCSLVVGTATTSCVYSINANRILVLGGRWEGTAGAGFGFTINGGTTHLEVIGVAGLSLGTFVKRVGGTVGFASVTASFTDATIGIDWPSAAIPTNGLVVNGNALLCATPVNGHNPLSARTNYKANTVSGALYTETPIVP